ncbi:hypothetical protein [Pedobacter foliorum]|uniref:hypothetical protein n=1 Tax=Pedobacter foliorum TaxID=2739058 RepID=UPI001566FC33|nr:hypothetical protein [Pedobacter foliorum]NRF41262.1 hypothetical protein [Pedobacter foliorum]
METNKPQIDKLYFKAFRAIDNRADCMKFIEGHTHVLEVFGITQITSAKIDWVLNPDVYVVLVSETADGPALGGGRIHIANGKNPLPIEDAVGHMDERIYKMVEERTEAGTGEFCALWNSWEIAGLGIGSIYLGRTFIALAHRLKLKTLFGLCAPATYRNSIKIGFRILREIGIDGKFYYPKEQLTATSLLVEDIDGLPLAPEDERNEIFRLRSERVTKTDIVTSKGTKIELTTDFYI